MTTLPLKNTQQPFAWVKPELEKSVGFVHAALESYGKDLNDLEPLLPAIEQLHLLRGSLHILELYGAALLIEDMERTVKALIAKTLANNIDAYESLVKATISLEGYLDKLSKDPADIPVVLLPIINDLRASRNEPLLTESSLFNPNLSIVPKFSEKAIPAQGAAEQLAETAKALRPYYQAALLSWYHNPKDSLSLQQMKLVLRNLESSCFTPRLRQLYWIAGGLVEALADGGLTSNVSIRLLLGQTDRTIKLLMQKQDSAFEKTPPVDLLKNMLFYIAHSASHGDRVNILKKAYQLDAILPTESDLKNLRENIRSPKSETFAIIATELNKTIQKIKSVIDAFVRGNSKDPAQLGDVLLPLKHIADTLSLISLGKERQLLLKQIEHSAKVIAEKRVPTRDELISLASAIVHIESVIENIGNERRTNGKPTDKFTEKRRSRLANSTTMEITTPGASLNRLPETEYRILVQKATSEAKNNVTTIKNNVLAFLTSPGKEKMLDDVPRLLNEIRGCLIIVDHQYAADLSKALSDYTQTKLLNSEIQPPKADLDEFAEAIVGLEFYLESIADGRAQLESILEITRESLVKLGFRVDPPRNLDTRAIPTLETVVTKIHEGGKAKTAKSIVELAPKPKSANELKEAKVESLPAEEEIDPEVMQIFIEEAEEEIASMEKHIKSLLLSPDDKNALTSIRRVFHTLKGSGRIAGANQISEFATAVESLVNGGLIGALTMGLREAALIKESHDLLPALLASYRDRTPSPIATNRLIQNIIDILHGKEIEKPAASLAVVTPTAETPVETLAEPTRLPPKPIEDKTPAAPEKFVEVEIPAAQPSTSAAAATSDNDVREASRQIDEIEKFIDDRRSNPKGATASKLVTIVEKLQQVSFNLALPEFKQTVELLLRYANNLARNTQPIQRDALDILSEFCVTTREILGSTAASPSPVEVTPPAAAAIEEAEPIAPIAAPVETNRSVYVEPEDDFSLIDIFFEEARELIAQGNANLEQWKKQPPPVDAIEALQRVLHTLKGSARMAGITVVGNIGHALEHILEEILHDRIKASEDLNDLLQSAFDGIGDILDDLSQGVDIKSQDRLFAQIQRYTDDHNGNSVAEAQAPQVPEPVVEARAPAPEEPPLVEEPAKRGDTLRIDAQSLDSLINFANDENISQRKIEEHVTGLKSNLLELDRTVARLRGQMRDVEFDGNTNQPLSRTKSQVDISNFTAQQEVAQRVLESLGDLENIHGTLTRLTLETDNLLHQQRKMHTELYEGLLNTRMVTFSNQNQRLQKVLRQAARDLDKKAKLIIEGADGALDRSLIENLMGPLEHILRNAVAHGIESPAERQAKGKDETGTITLTLSRQGGNQLISISDDGAGINTDAIRNKALKLGIIKTPQQLSEDELLQLIFESGFSTSNTVSQVAGRGIGMDVVNTEVQKLGGTINIETKKDQGTTFLLSLPITVSLTKTLIAHAANSVYAFPTIGLEGTHHITGEELARLYRLEKPAISIDGRTYPLWYLDTLLNNAPPRLPSMGQNATLLLLRSNRTRVAIHVDEVVETRDSVLKATGPQLQKIKGIAGATVLNEGQVALIVDVAALSRMAILHDRSQQLEVTVATKTPQESAANILVVDDSITVRKVTERFLKRHGYHVRTAKDGVDALEAIEAQKPDLMLLDIEMPRMDGIEVTKRIRSNTEQRSIPIIMITSRAGKAHRDAAMQAGVSVFLGKPFQETQLLEHIQHILSTAKNKERGA